MPTQCCDDANTPEYYSEVARRFEKLADYVRLHADINPKIADHLKAFVDDILSDGRNLASSRKTA